MHSVSRYLWSCLKGCGVLVNPDLPNASEPANISSSLSLPQSQRPNPIGSQW